MSTATVTHVRGTKLAVASWLATGAWAVVLGAASGSAFVAVRLFFRLLHLVFVQQTGMLPIAAATLPPARRVLTPILGAAFATVVVWLMQRSAPDLRLKNKWKPFVSEMADRFSFDGMANRFLRLLGGRRRGDRTGGSMIQFAAAISSWVGERSPLRNLSLSRKVAYGAAAAVAAAYQAPIAGVFFATEILLGEWAWNDAPQLLLASSTGWLVSHLLLGAGPLFAVRASLPITHDLLWVVLLALVLGAVGPVYQKLIHLSRAAKRLPFALLWSGLSVGVLALIEPRVWGNGDSTLLGILQNKMMLFGIVSLFTCRGVATTFCVGTGTVGGVFTPTLFAGAALGLATGHAAILDGISGRSGTNGSRRYLPDIFALSGNGDGTKTNCQGKSLLAIAPQPTKIGSVCLSTPGGLPRERVRRIGKCFP